MKFLTWSGIDAISMGQNIGLTVLKKHDNLNSLSSLPAIYESCKSEFDNGIAGTSSNLERINFSILLFENNTFKIIEHTCFTRKIYDIIHYSHLQNLPLRSFQNGIGHITLASIVFALYATLLYLRTEM
jgi:hypothetical protein